jgi:hypothetical protein
MALLILAVVAGNGAVRGLGLDGLAVRRQPCAPSSAEFNVLLGRITAVVFSRSG